MAEASPKHESGGYKEPPKVIKDLVVGVGNPGLKLSPTGRWALVANQPELPSIAEVATPVVRLAGARWHAKTRLPDTLRWYLCAGMRLRPIVDQAGAPFPGSEDGRYDVPVSAGLPADAEFQYAQWRCDGAAIAMLVRSRCWGLEPSAQVKLTVPPKIEVWVVHFDEEAAVQRARRISALGSPAAAGKSSAGVSTMEHPHDASSTGSPRDGGAGAGAGGDHAIAECAVAVRVVAGRTVYGIRNWPISWLGATGRLLVRLAPAHQPKFPPEHPDVPLGPLVMESDGTASPSRTYQDLIKSPHDADLFAYYSTHCLYVFDVSHGPASRSLPANESVPSPDSPPGQLLGSAAGDLYTHVSLSPDATKVLVRALRRPFSYQVPARRFATLVRLWDVGQALVCSQPEHESGGQRERKSRSADGTKTTISSTIAIRKDVEICSLPAQESIPISFDARPCGPRNWMWHALEPATLVYTEALDGGDPSQNLTASELFRDALYTLSGPRYRLPRTAEQSSGDPARNPDKAMSSPSNAVAPPAHQPPHDQTCIFQTEHRISRVAWSATGACFVVDGWRKTRRRRLWIQHPTIGSPSAHAASPSAPTAQKKWHIIPDFDCQYEDRYASPGSFGMVTEAKDGTHRVQLAPDGRVVLFGQGASPRGDRPFLDLMDISVPGGDYTRERLWRCPAGPIGRDGCDGDEDCNVFGSSVSHRSTRTIATTEVDLRGLEDPRQEVGGVPVDDSARAAVYEKAVEIFDNGLLLTRRESKSSPPNYYLTRLPMAAAWDPTPGDQDSQTVYPIPVTQFPHPQPQLLGVAKTHLHYVREDGVLLDAQLYLPAGYDPTRDGPRPCLMWAYPAEFKSRKAAGQVPISQAQQQRPPRNCLRRACCFDNVNTGESDVSCLFCLCCCGRSEVRRTNLSEPILLGRFHGCLEGG